MVSSAAAVILSLASAIFFFMRLHSAAAAPGGRWDLLLPNAGIASMHTAVTHYGNVVFLDRTNVGPSQINLTDGRCRDNPADITLTHDCTAHSVLFSPSSNSVRPLFIFTDTWCSSGQFFPDGTLVQTGGEADGIFKVRRFAPCADDAQPPCDWVEADDLRLVEGRWYASNQLLPDGRQIVVGGRSAFTYEFIPPAAGESPVFLSFLNQTNDVENDNYYPFLHLLPDGNLYIFANRDSIIYDYRSSSVVKTFPTIPGEPRNYPSAGSSVMLPISATGGDVEVLVCGGAQPNCFLFPAASPDASQTCGRITVTSDAPQWVMETMPIRRAMGDMLLLPTGDVLIINGAQNGCQGWGNAANPALSPVLYSPTAPEGSRFAVMTATTIPRMYHSTANLLSDGRVLLAGSNTHEFYTFTGDFPTELRVEAYVPEYGDAEGRPKIVWAPDEVKYGQEFTVEVETGADVTAGGGVVVRLMSAPYTTHSYSQGLRSVELGVSGVSDIGGGNGTYGVNTTAPGVPELAPPAYYMLWVVVGGLPSVAAWWVKVAA